MKEQLMDEAPTGAIGRCSKSGWINEELFMDWFEHFVNYVQPKSRKDPTLLLFDGHSTHTKNLDLILKAEENNVVLLSLPSHCTHRLQPLDRSLFKSLNSYYNKEVHSWLRSHPGRVVTEYHVSGLFRNAYNKAATLENSVSGFRACGVVPFRPDIFSDEDFIAAEISNDRPPAANIGSTTDKESECDAQTNGVHNENDEQQVIANAEPTTPVEPAPAFLAVTEMDPAEPAQAPVFPAVTDMDPAQPAPIPVSPAVTNTNPVEPVPSCSGVVATAPMSCHTESAINNDERVNEVSFSELIAACVEPREPTLKRKRKVAHAAILTSSPYKRELRLDSMKRKKPNVTRKQGRKMAMRSGKKVAKTVNSQLGKGVMSKQRKPPLGKLSKPTGGEDWRCVICKEFWSECPEGEEWIRCQICGDWAHVLCSSLEGRADSYICDYCFDIA